MTCVIRFTVECSLQGYRSLLTRLHWTQSIWQFSAMFLPPLDHGVMWSPCISLMSNTCRPLSLPGVRQRVPWAHFPCWLIGRPDFAVVKLADAEVALVAGEQVEWQVFVQLPTDLLLRVALCNEVVSS